MFWANGDYYEGNWDNGKPKGYGKKLFTLDNGDKYEGETIDGLPHGLGRYSYVNGDIFEGEYENGTQKQNGYGLYKFVNGDTLKSYWVSKNGSLLPEGQGQYTYSNGDIFIGEYKNGKMLYTIRMGFILLIINCVKWAFRFPYFLLSFYVFYGFIISFIFNEKKIVSKDLGKFIRNYRYKKMKEKILG